MPLHPQKTLSPFKDQPAAACFTSKVERLQSNPGMAQSGKNNSLVQKIPESQEATGLVFRESIS
jgi:hypothetical protein